jgi:hypothetical protein
MRLRSVLSVLAMTSFTVVPAAVVPTAVVPAAADVGDVPAAVVHTAVNHLSDARMDAYWTPERIANAKPVPVPEAPAATAVPAAKPDGPAVAVPGTPGRARGVFETTGRLLFSANGGDWICTATVVASKNASVIATARHCGFNGGGGNFRYAPDYNAGNAPHGWWTGGPRAGPPVATASPTTWRSSCSPRRTAAAWATSSAPTGSRSTSR